jgi:hypothetical protein
LFHFFHDPLPHVLCQSHNPLSEWGSSYSDSILLSQPISQPVSLWNSQWSGCSALLSPHYAYPAPFIIWWQQWQKLQITRPTPNPTQKYLPNILPQYINSTFLLWLVVNIPLIINPYIFLYSLIFKIICMKFIIVIGISLGQKKKL